MSRTPNQQMADAHEADMAEWTEGTVTKGSGNQWHAQMDAVNGTRNVLIPMAGDGKCTLAKQISVTKDMWAKAVKQAGPVRTPFLALRWYSDPVTLKVEQDLVVVSAQTFRRLLEGARKWEEFDQGVELFAEALALDPQAPEDLATGCDCCR